MNKRIAASVAAGKRLADALPVVAGVVEWAPIDFAVLGQLSWDERRAREWSYIGAIARRDGDIVTSDYCLRRIEELG